MSFARQVKLEIMESRPPRNKAGTALPLGMLQYATRYHSDEIALLTSMEEVAERFGVSLKLLGGKQVEYGIETVPGGGGGLYRVTVPRQTDRDFLTACHPPGQVDEERLSDPQELHAFLAGAFLSCGSMTDPEKGYHLEFVAGSPDMAQALVDLLEGQPLRITRRRGQSVVYCKECAQIEDLLTMMGASHSSLSMIDVEMIKGVRNQANRVTNCETANIDKQVGAATGQVTDIQLIFQSAGEETLSDQLREAAHLRLAHPDASLRELVELSPSPVSRSGMHHRLAALSRMAALIREEQAQEEQGNG